ncbi:MAG: class I SAM-dependent rRNA methyltransferase [Treponema sp.]|uniref:class I SAM-dependent rRNA methyltransferase n=1 Tax=Treponema sp. TaxID=166 RepID=UPI0025F2C1CF|nr:class I SAM-dependent rRNA methyltransferase [Treponema sp.]MBQ9622659.1 class I SAM-dependent rRNA methyltransferase [Treponema sp.]MBR0495784.1 class I SAM-dependent rRNA methyltransferase [Treponema sp.]
MYARVFLNKKEEAELKQGFPWVFDNEISHVKYDSEGGVKQTSLAECEVEDGSVVEVFANAGAFLGSGVINKKSKITVRMIGTEHADQIMADPQAFYDAKIQAAYDLRKLHYNIKDSYRLVYGEADFIPGLIVERYCDVNKNVYLVIQFSTLSCEVFRKEILHALRKIIKPYGIYEKSDAPSREKEGLSLRSAWEGEVREEKIVIRENDVLIEVDLANGQKTGYFLDQKDNRRYVAGLCEGKRVLDTFTHTGAFGLNAVKGGAKEVISVDISPEAVELVNKNIELNQAGKKMKAVCADVFDLLKEYEKNGEKFDVIVLDPPAFTKTAKNIEKAYGGYKEINLRAMRLLNPNGILVTCSCSYFFDSEHFYGMVMKAAEDSKKRVQVLAKFGAGPDHPVLLGYPKSEYLKCAVCRVI